MPENEEFGDGELPPSEVRTAMSRIEQKKLAIQLIESQRYVVKSRTGVPICEDQVEMIDDVVEQLGAAAEAVWPGDDMPPVEEIAEGEWVEEVTEDETDVDSEAEDEGE